MMTRRHMIGSALVASAAGIAEAADVASPVLRSQFAFEARVSVASPLAIGEASLGLRRVVPITGGTVTGPKLEGRVIPGGADWQFVRPDGVLAIEAKYTLESEDGVLIMVTNRGMRHGSRETIDKLTRGERVDPSQYYFRTTAEFEAPSASRYAWLNRAVFVGVAERSANAALVRFFEVL